MDKVAVFQITEYNSRVQIQQVPINEGSYVTGFCVLFIYGVLQGDYFVADTFTYFNNVSIRIPCGYSIFSFQIKKTEEFSGNIHEYLAKVKSIPSLQMHDLLEILEHAFSLLVDFSSIRITACYIYKKIWAKLLCSNL